MFVGTWYLDRKLGWLAVTLDVGSVAAIEYNEISHGGVELATLRITNNRSYDIAREHAELIEESFNRGTVFEQPVKPEGE